MKKIDVDAVEKFAKEKNIDKNKIEEIAESYQGKSQDELMEELINIGKTLQGKEEVVEKFKAFLDENQRKKVDSIMNKITAAEVKDKVSSKKAKKSKSEPAKEESNSKKSSKQSPSKDSKSSKGNKDSKSSKDSSSSKSPKSGHSDDTSKSTKKVKKVVKKSKHSSDEE
ncbi:MAG: hypothetical protein ACRDB0_03055 [Paraclostridium sp.]